MWKPKSPGPASICAAHAGYFLADGDAMSLSTRRLLRILELVRQHLPEVARISSYCSSFNLHNKSVAELRTVARGRLEADLHGRGIRR